MTTTSFAVVEFIDEKSVEIVCEKWIETCDGVSMVYFSDYKHQYVHVMIIQLYGSLREEVDSAVLSNTLLTW